jgi:hypothetical protein
LTKEQLEEERERLQTRLDAIEEEIEALPPDPFEAWAATKTINSEYTRNRLEEAFKAGQEAASAELFEALQTAESDL